MNLDNSYGAVDLTMKKVPIIEDTLCTARITACKHANGRDWWVVVREYLSNRYYKLLITPDTIFITTQSIGFKFSKNDALGMAVFSPDGEYYAHLNNDDTLQIMKFNRCTGEFANPVIIQDLDSVWTNGCSFSPSGRFLYVSSYLHIFQFDLWAADVTTSEKVVGTYQDVDGAAQWFSLMQLAPDNKIYVSPYISNTLMHVINSPDSLGLACDFQQGAINLPSYNSMSLPNFPNYDLSVLQGSPCDTLYLNASISYKKEHTFSISPNPSSLWLNITYQSEEDGLFELEDFFGKQVKALSLFHYYKSRLLDVSDLPSGMYLAIVTQKGKQVWSKKVVVVH